MDTLFLIYGDHFVTLDRSKEKIRQYESDFDVKTKERKSIMKEIRLNKALTYKERYDLKKRCELLEVQLRHIKGYLYIEEAR
jgi:hypothetical protein